MTAKQLALLRYICGYQEAHGGVTPSFRDCAFATGQAFSGVARNLDRLAKWGYLRRLSNRARAIEVLRPVPVPRAPDGAPLYVVPL